MHKMRNEKLFYTSMAVMAYCKEREKKDKKFKKDTSEWFRDLEYAQLSYRVYNMLGNEPYNKEKVISITEDIINTQLADIRYFAEPQEYDQYDTWHGVSSGQNLGYPSEKGLEKIRKIFRECSGYDDDEFYLLLKSSRGRDYLKIHDARGRKPMPAKEAIA